jgi:uncharacterized protein
MSRGWVVHAGILVAALWLWPSAAGAATPSFDCETARSDVEKLICRDDELAALDVAMAKAFAKALAVAPANTVSTLKTQQKDWRRTLMNCGKTADIRQCTLDTFRRRLDEI